MNWKRWTKEEEEKLIEIYPDEKNINIAEFLNKTIDQVERKASSLNLKKSKEQKSKNIATRNKTVGRDLSYENLKNLALKYKTRGEFQRLDSSAYTTARIAGYLDDVCSHMICSSYSIPQLILFSIIRKLFNTDKIEYNYKNIIKPYELDIYIKKYKIGFEYDGKLWHINNELDIIKDKLCESNNITLIRLKENSRKYIFDVKNQLIENLKIINSTCNKNISEEDILNIEDKYINDFVNDEIIDEDKIIKIISKYDNYFDFRTKEISLYQKLIKRGLIKKYTEKLKRNIQEWNEEKILTEINKYDNLGDFIEKSNSCYLYIKRYNLFQLTKNLKRTSKFSIVDVQNEINKYEFLKDFREKSSKYYSYVKKNKLHYLIENLKRTKNKKPHFSIDDIVLEIEKYEFLKDFKEKSLKHYKFVMRHHLYDLIKDLKRNKPLYSNQELKDEIEKYEYLCDFRVKSNSQYRFIQRYNINLNEYLSKLK